MKKILLITGEVSGDHHAAALISELQKMEMISVFGIGGDALQEQGMKLLYHIKDMAFLGIGEIIRHLPFINKVKNDLVLRAKIEQPDCVLLVDYPGFNLRMARIFKRMGIPIVYYISPQLWAWGKRRVEKIRRYVDEMLVLFPFEQKFYERHQIRVEYVGHPIIDKYTSFLPKEHRRLDQNNITIGLMPGSRKQEVETLLPRLVETVRILLSENKIHHAEIVKVPHLAMDLYTSQLVEKDDSIRIVEEAPQNCLPRYDALLVASGTATLEAGLFNVPMAIVYHVNSITFWLAKMLITIDSIGLVNIVAEKNVAPELIQNDFTPEITARQLEILLIPEKNLEIRESLNIIKEKLGEPGASGRAAQKVLEFLNERQSS